MDLIQSIQLYKDDEKGMKKGKEIETRGIEERENFLSRYSIEDIPNLSIEQYTLGTDSFIHQFLYGLSDFARPGKTFPSDFGIYSKKGSSDILLSDDYKKDFGSDYKNTFIDLKKEIVNFLEDVRQKNYDNLESYSKINKKVKNRLMIVYFYDRFVPVCSEGKINGCLKSVGIPFERKSMIDKNLALVEWKKSKPKLADWSNLMVLNFCDWLNKKNIILDKEETGNNTVIEEAQKIEEEINFLNVKGVEKKAIINTRVNQGIFRELLLKKYNKCCLCNVENQALLIASHIKPWAESEPTEKLDVNNGFLMCPNHDRLFDKGYITFDDDGNIKISDTLKENDKIFLNVNSSMHIHKLTESNKKYLKFHRENIFIDK